MESVSYIPAHGEKKAAALLLHGLTATTVEMMPLAKHLAERGVTSTVPLLPGHGTSLQDLRVTPLSAFLETVTESFDRIESGGKKISIIGESFGSLLALWLALRFPERIESICLLSPPMKFRSKMRERLLGGICSLPDFALNRLGLVPKRRRSHSHYQFPFISYNAHSIAAGARLVKLRREVVEQLGSVRCPVCVIHDPNDHHLSAEILPLFLGQLGSESKELIAMKGGEHELLVGPRGREVFDCIASFLERVQHAA